MLCWLTQINHYSLPAIVMNMPLIAKISDFLNDIQSISPSKFEMATSIREIFSNADSNLTEEIKYGGLMFRRSNHLIGGVFIYKQHLSIEFGQGAKMDDPENLLEGKGQYRRHLKIRQLQDIEGKKVAGFVDQALSI